MEKTRWLRASRDLGERLRFLSFRTAGHIAIAGILAAIGWMMPTRAAAQFDDVLRNVIQGVLQNALGPPQPAYRAYPPMPYGGAPNPPAATIAIDQPSGTTKGSPQPSAASYPQLSIVGEWEGAFSCDSVADNAFDIAVSQDASGSLEGVLRFTLTNRPDGAGRFTLRGAPAPDGQFTLAPQEWIQRPAGFNPFGLMGQVAGNGNTVTGKLLGCGSTAFVAHRKAVVERDGKAAAPLDDLEPPVAGGPLEGRWQGASICSRGNRTDDFPITVTVSQQDSALAALVSESIPDPRTHAPMDLQGIFLSEAVGGGGSLHGNPVLPNRLVLAFPTSLQLDNVDGSIRAGFYAPNCKASLTQESAAYPGGFGQAAEGLLGAWSTPSSARDYEQQHPHPGLFLILPYTAASLEFMRKGDLLYGRLQAFDPTNKPPSERDHLSVDLRPIVTTVDGRVGFVSTRVWRAEGNFAPGSRGFNSSMLAQGFFLLVRPPNAQDRELEVALSSAKSCCAAAPNMLFLRRDEAEIAQIAAGGVRVELPPGIGGRLAAARSFRAQCDALEEWSRPLTARPDAQTQIIVRLEPEAVPLFDEDAFVPVFGLPYIAMSAAQLKPFFYLMARDCPQQLGMRDLDHTLLYSPFSGPEGSFGYAAVTAALMNRRAAKATIAEAAKRLPALPATDAGLAEVGKLERETPSSLALLTEKERQAFAAMLADNRTRIARGILETRIGAIGDLPASEGSLDQLDRLRADVEASSALPADEKTRAASSVGDRARAIVAALVADAGQRAASAPLSLQGLAETKGVIEHSAKLEWRTSADGRSAPESGSGPATARRAAILADAGVQKAFGDAMLGEARQSASPAAVQAAAARLLLPEEIAAATGASPYRASIDTAMRQAEEEHQRHVLATEAAAAPPPSRSTPSASTVPGENDVRQAVAIFYETALRGTGMLDAGCSIATEPGCTVRTPGIAKTVYISTFELSDCGQDKENKLVCRFTIAFHCGLTALSSSSSESLSNPFVRGLYCADFGSGVPSNGQAYLVPTSDGWRILPEQVPD